MASYLQLILLSLAIGAFGQDSTPSGPTHPGSPSNCNSWYTVQNGDSCWSVETAFGLTHAQFIALNPAISEDCITNFWPTYSYCVGTGTVTSGSTTTTSTGTGSGSSTTTSTGGTTTGTGSITTTTSANSTDTGSITTSTGTGTFTTTSVNTTYSIKNPITSYNLTSPTIDRTWPPQKTQAGLSPHCIKWYLVEAKETCETIARKFGSSMTLEQFLEWNPAVDTDCSGLYLGWWVCVGIQSQSSMTLTYETPSTSVDVPPYNPYTPTTFPAINSSFTATPTNPGLAANCQSFYQAQAGDTCNVVLSQYNWITREEFFDWNPALSGNCGGLWENYWYCVAAFPSGVRPMPPTVTVKPTPIQSGSASNCVAWYQMTLSDTCDSIAAMFGTFSSSDFIGWNPGVWQDCANIRENYYYCVGVPDTPTTRTDALPTTTTIPDTPTQSGIAEDCSSFWLVSSQDTCESIAELNDISLADFYEWNPAVGTTECDDLLPDYNVCVAVGGGVTSTGTGTTGTSSTTTSGTTGTTATSPTTTATGPVSTPTPTQAGMVSGCRRFYLVQSGDGCWAIANSAGIALEDFYSWNPFIGECVNLWPETYVCIGRAGPVTTITSGPPVPTS